MYKYAIKHFNSVFFSLYRIFDIVQYSVDAVYIAGALFEDWVLMQVRCVLRHCTLRRESGTWRGNLRAVRGGGVGSLLRLCPTGGTIPPLAHFRGGLPLWRVPEAASWAISCFRGCCRKGAQGGEQLEKGCGSRERRMLAERTMLSLVTSRVPTLDGMVLSWRSQPWENRDREESSCLRTMKSLRNPV